VAETGVRDQQRVRSNRIHLVQRWVARRLGTTRHERRVLRIAVRLFDLLSRFHGLDHSHRRLLKFGALLHDVGRAYGARKHHIAGARMVLESPSLPLRSFERIAAAYLTRYHRKQVPDLRQQSLVLDADAHSDLQVLLAILRAADALDSRRVPSRALAMRLSGRRLEIHVYIDGQWRRACRAFRKRRKFRLLRTTLDISVKLRLRRSDVPYDVCGCV
jgi:exopolyphosphatase/pppGpp-phosphohydrolase